MSKVLKIVTFLSFVCLIKSACVHNNDCEKKEVCEFGYCFTSKNLTEECSFDSQCLVEDEYSFCYNGTCSCRVGYTTRGVACLSSPDGIVFPDEDTDEAATETPPSHRRPSETPTTSGPEYKDCLTDKDCSDGNICTLDDLGFGLTWKCLPLAGIYSPCRSDSQCSRHTPMTHCRNQHCSCFYNMYFNGTECVMETTHSFTSPRPDFASIVRLILQLLLSGISLAIGLGIFFLVRRFKRRRATTRFQEEKNGLAHLSGDDAGPLPPKPAVIEVSPYNPDMYPNP